MATNNPKKEKRVSHQTGSNQRDYVLFERIREMCQDRPRVAILMSGTGSNARKILEERHRYPNLNVVAMATDRLTSQASLIASQFGLSFIFAKQHEDYPSCRQSFFYDLCDKLRFLRVDFLLYAGFMKIVPVDFLTEFPGLNIHPADLTMVTNEGTPEYIGITAVSSVINAGESYIASTMHVVEEAVDGGVVIAVSKHVPLLIGQPYDAHELQEKLKRIGEHTLYPQVLALLSRGKITRDMLPLLAERQDLNMLLDS